MEERSKIQMAREILIDIGKVPLSKSSSMNDRLVLMTIVKVAQELEEFADILHMTLNRIRAMYTDSRSRVPEMSDKPDSLFDAIKQLCDSWGPNLPHHIDKLNSFRNQQGSHTQNEEMN